MLRDQESVQIVVGDPGSDPSEVELLLALGERSLLMVPVVSRGESVGIIEAYRTRRARLVPRRDQPRPRDREPVRRR